MKVGLIGLPLAGKTTIFNLLCGVNAPVSTYLSGKMEPNHGMARVADSRVDRLSEMYKPRKTIYAQIETTDLPGLRHSQGGGGNLFLQQVRQVDALVQVIRVFEGDVEHADGTTDPLRDADNVQAELLMADIDLVEKRMERIREGRKVTSEQQSELVVLEKCLASLQEERPMAAISLTPLEQQLISHYGFLTQKPQLLVCNLDENQFKAGSFPGQMELVNWAGERGFLMITLCAALEEEISRLPSAERSLFLEDLGVKDPAAARLVNMMYSLIGQISFFTVGEDEVRAWTIASGTEAKKAAGKIHSDLERGFIRAETASSEDLFAHGSMTKLKEKGLLRLEGKEYIVKDGDILNIRFNV